MNTEPLGDFFKAAQAYKAGNEASAKEMLAKSLGLPQLTPYLEGCLKQACNAEDPNMAIVTLLVDRMQR